MEKRKAEEEKKKEEKKGSKKDKKRQLKTKETKPFGFLIAERLDVGSIVSMIQVDQELWISFTDGRLSVFSLSGEFRFDVVASKASSRMYVMFHEPLNHHLLAVTEIGELIVWEDMGQGECVFQRKLGHEKMVKSGALIGQRQNPTIWTGDVTGEIKVWSVGDFQLMHEFLAGDGLEKGPSAVLSLVGKGGYAWAGMGNGMIHRYHCVSFIVSLSINAHPDSKVNQIVEIEEKSWLASCSDNGDVSLWSSSDGSSIVRFQLHTEKVVCLCVSPGGDYLFSGSFDSTFCVYDLETFESWQFSGYHTDTIRGFVSFQIEQFVDSQAPEDEKERRNVLVVGGRDSKLTSWIFPLKKVGSKKMVGVPKIPTEISQARESSQSETNSKKGKARRISSKFKSKRKGRKDGIASPARSFPSLSSSSPPPPSSPSPSPSPSPSLSPSPSPSHSLSPSPSPSHSLSLSPSPSPSLSPSPSSLSNMLTTSAKLSPPSSPAVSVLPPSAVRPKIEEDPYLSLLNFANLEHGNILSILVISAHRLLISFASGIVAIFSPLLKLRKTLSSSKSPLYVLYFSTRDIVISISKEGILSSWNIKNENEPKPLLEGHSLFCSNLNQSVTSCTKIIDLPDNSVFCVGTKEGIILIFSFDLDSSMTQLGTTKIKGPVLCMDASCSPENTSLRGITIWVGSKGIIYGVNAQIAEVIVENTGHSCGDINSLVYLPKKHELWSCGSTGSIEVFDSKERNLVVIYDGDNRLTYLTLTPDHQRMLCGDQEGYIYQFNLLGKKLVSCIDHAHVGLVRSLACDPELQVVWSGGGAEGVVKGWAEKQILSWRSGPPSIFDVGKSGRSVDLLHALSKGLGVEGRNSKGQTILHVVASRLSQLSLLEFLVSLGKPGLEEVDEEGKTALHTAVLAGCGAAVLLLLQSGADPLKQSKNGSDCFEYARWGCQRDAEGATVVMNLLNQKKQGLPLSLKTNFEKSPLKPILKNSSALTTESKNQNSTSSSEIPITRNQTMPRFSQPSPSASSEPLKIPRSNTFTSVSSSPRACPPLSPSPLSPSPLSSSSSCTSPSPSSFPSSPPSSSLSSPPPSIHSMSPPLPSVSSPPTPSSQGLLVRPPIYQSQTPKSKSSSQYSAPQISTQGSPVRLPQNRSLTFGALSPKTNSPSLLRQQFSPANSSPSSFPSSSPSSSSSSSSFPSSSSSSVARQASQERGIGAVEINPQMEIIVALREISFVSIQIEAGPRFSEKIEKTIFENLKSVARSLLKLSTLDGSKIGGVRAAILKLTHYVKGLLQKTFLEHEHIKELKLCLVGCVTAFWEFYLSSLSASDAPSACVSAIKNVVEELNGLIKPQQNKRDVFLLRSVICKAFMNFSLYSSYANLGNEFEKCQIIHSLFSSSERFFVCVDTPQGHGEAKSVHEVCRKYQQMVTAFYSGRLPPSQDTDAAVQAVLSCKSKLFEAIDQYSFSQSLYGGEEGELICSLVRNLASTIDEDHLASNPFQFTRISECLSRILNLKCWQFSFSDSQPSNSFISCAISSLRFYAVAIEVNAIFKVMEMNKFSTFPSPFLALCCYLTMIQILNGLAALSLA